MKKTTFWLLAFFFINIQTVFAQNNTGLIHNLRGHFTSVQSLAFSDDGKTLMSVSSNPQSKMSEVKIWDTSTGKESKSFQEQEQVLSVSANKNYFVTGGTNHLKVWHKEVKGGSMIEDFSSQKDVSIVKVSKISDGYDLKIATGGNKKIIVRNWINYKKRANRLFTFNTKHKVKDIAFGSVQENPLSSSSRKDKYIAFCGGDIYAGKGFIQVEDISRGKSQTVFKLETESVVNSVDFSVDGDAFIFGTEDGKLIIKSIRSHETIKDLSQRFGQISKVAFSPDGRFVLSASKNSNIKLWQVSNGKLIHTFRGHFKGVNDIAFSQKGGLIASAGEDKMVKIWQALPTRRMIELYVEDKMRVWQKKGKYEKTSDYQARVSGQQRQAKIAEYTQEAINVIAKESVELTPVRSDYDADNEAFRLVFNNVQPIFVKIPVEDAPAFDKALQDKSLKFDRSNFTLGSQDKMALLSAKITNKQNQKTYDYNAQDLVAFNPNQLNLEFDPITIDTPTYTNNQNNNQGNNGKVRVNGISEVDYDLPKTKTQKPDAIAVVIGNALYQKTKNVDYAIADARAVRNYLLDVMGFKRGNIIYLENASYTDFKLIFGDKDNHKGKLYNLVKPNVSEVFIFYSGHGAPGLKDKKAYFVPAECDPQYVELTGYPTDYFYNNLAKIPAKSTVVTLDACFSGENIYENISPIVIKSKGALGLKNGALLASCKADQVSTWYNEKGHGMFTYFFLKAIHNKNADENKDNQLTLEEIHKYITDNANGVPYYARRLHGIEQNPVIKGQNPKKVLVEYE